MKASLRHAGEDIEIQITKEIKVVVCANMPFAINGIESDSKSALVSVHSSNQSSSCLAKVLLVLHASYLAAL